MKYFFSFLPPAVEYLSAQTVDKKLFSPEKKGGENSPFRK